MPKKQKKLTKKQRVAAIKEKQFNEYYEEFQDSTDKKSKEELGRFLVKQKHKAQKADPKNKDNFVYTIVINVRSTGYNKFGNPFELSDFLSSIAEDFENLPGIFSVDLMVGKNEKKRGLVEILCRSDALIQNLVSTNYFWESNIALSYIDIMIDGETIRDNYQLIDKTIDEINTQMEKDHPMMFKEVMTEIKAEFEPKFKQLGVDYDSRFEYDNNISSLPTLDLLDMDQEIINHLNTFDEFFDMNFTTNFSENYTDDSFYSPVLEEITMDNTLEELEIPSEIIYTAEQMLDIIKEIKNKDSPSFHHSLTTSRYGGVLNKFEVPILESRDIILINNRTKEEMIVDINKLEVVLKYLIIESNKLKLETEFKSFMMQILVNYILLFKDLNDRFNWFMANLLYFNVNNIGKGSHRFYKRAKNNGKLGKMKCVNESIEFFNSDHISFSPYSYLYNNHLSSIGQEDCGVY
jgi:hypothetical protein